LADPATLSGFRLDEYLVTVGRFRQFVVAWNNGCGWMPGEGEGKHTHLNAGLGLANTAGGYETGWDAAGWNNLMDIDPTNDNLLSCSGYSTWTASAGAQENLPINCVTWWEAYAFCIWDGGFLPSEAEWEYAAAGGSQQLEYPWGLAAPGTNSQFAIYDCNYPTPGGSCSGNIAPVGTASMGAGAWGQFDLAGDLYEWNLDWYASPYVDPCTDCVNLSPASGRVIRGAYFASYPVSLLPPIRIGGNPPSSRVQGVGFRCARAP
jgi:formylglycine-generating enzyme required for sulfatase activity